MSAGKEHSPCGGEEGKNDKGHGRTSSRNDKLRHGDGTWNKVCIVVTVNVVLDAVLDGVYALGINGVVIYHAKQLDRSW